MQPAILTEEELSTLPKERSIHELLFERTSPELPEPPVTPLRIPPQIPEPFAPRKRKERSLAFFEEIGDTQRLKRMNTLKQALPDLLETALKNCLNPSNVVLHELRFSLSGEAYHIIFHSPDDAPETEFNLDELPLNKREKVLMVRPFFFLLHLFF